MRRNQVTKKSPLVSCIVPTLNSGKYLGETLESVKNQTYSPIEIIVVDGGSKDNTLKIAKKYTSKIIKQKGKGPADARNEGIKNAKGDFIAFIDSDDLWEKNKIEKQVNYFKNNSNMDICLTNVKMFFEKELENEKKYFKNHPRMKSIPGYATITLLAKKDVFDKIGFFDEDLKFTDAVEWLRKARKKLNMKIIREVLVFHRLHKENITRKNRKKSEEEFIKLVKRNIDEKNEDA